MKGLGAEVAKNVTLAGVKSVTLLDDGVVTKEDIISQFLVPSNHLGKNVTLSLRLMALVQTYMNSAIFVFLRISFCFRELKHH